MPMPKPVCITKLYNKIVQLQVCITFSGRGMGINGTAHITHVKCLLLITMILQQIITIIIIYILLMLNVYYYYYHYCYYYYYN